MYINATLASNFTCYSCSQANIFTFAPTSIPTGNPALNPNWNPTSFPTNIPTVVPTNYPTVIVPSLFPSSNPSYAPTAPLDISSITPSSFMIYPYFVRVWHV